jgi:hypothetical protein
MINIEIKFSEILCIFKINLEFILLVDEDWRVKGYYKLIYVGTQT